MRRTKEEAARTRARLLKAALSVFASRGYAATTLEDIALQAGVTRGAIYWHFQNKAELYDCLLVEYSARGNAIVGQAISEGGNFRDILKRILVRLLSAFEDDPELGSAMALALFTTDTSPELAAARQRQLEAGRGLLDGIADAMLMGVAAGELRPDIDTMQMARAFMAMQNGAVSLWLADPGSFSLKNAAGPLAEIFVSGISRSSE